MPGTHIKPSEASEEEEGLLCAGPAGTLAIHHQSIVHRRARQMDEAEGVYRHMLKYLPRQTFLLILSTFPTGHLPDRTPFRSTDFVGQVLVLEERAPHARLDGRAGLRSAHLLLYAPYASALRAHGSYM